MEFRYGFATALKFLRLRQGLSQEDFSVVSSRTYLSQMERSETSPTLLKVDELSTLLGVHPASVTMLSYLVRCKDLADAQDLLTVIERDARQALEDFFSPQELPSAARRSR